MSRCAPGHGGRWVLRYAMGLLAVATLVGVQAAPASAIDRRAETSAEAAGESEAGASEAGASEAGAEAEAKATRHGAGTAAGTTAGGGLPVTGAPVALLLLVGLGLMVGGDAVLVAARPRRAVAAA